jgi:hypothetical protein
MPNRLSPLQVYTTPLNSTHLEFGGGYKASHLYSDRRPGSRGIGGNNQWERLYPSHSLYLYPAANLGTYRMAGVDRQDPLY